MPYLFLPRSSCASSNAPRLLPPPPRLQVSCLILSLTKVFSQLCFWTDVMAMFSKFSWGCRWPCLRLSPRDHLHLVGMLRVMSDMNQPSLPTPFYPVLVSISVFMALSTVFHSITSPTTLHFLTLFFRSYLCLIGLFNCMSRYESLLQP